MYRLAMALKKSKSSSNPGIRLGFRSGLEETVAGDLTRRGVPFTFEKLRVPYTTPAAPHKYTPDFQLPNGIVVETKGRFMPADRKKHLLVQEQHPELDIRFVFQRSKSPITKGSKTTYAMWSDKHGFKYADKVIPQRWIEEARK